GVLLVTYILHKESQIHRQQSLTDTLTGIGNRLALFEDLTARIERQTPFSFLLLDLNSFKPINDHYGHQAGDRVLRTIASRLTTLDADSYRIGGDEFAVVIDVGNENDLQLLIEHIHQLVESAIIIDSGIRAAVTTSIGNACYPQDAVSANELIFIADSNMYSQKHAQKMDFSDS
ncbi:MAG: GGDEF domain-containing protein, partial [Pseudomonadota bacterium]